MIRAARGSDLPEILDIYNEAILHTTAVYAYEPQTLEERQQWFQTKEAAGFPVLVMEEEGRVIGFATYGPFRPWPAYKYTVEHSVYVHPAYRRRGAGRRLLQELIRIVDENGYATLIAGIDSANRASIELHQALGFAYSGTIRRAGYKFGKWLDLVFYQLDLTGPSIQ